MRRLLAKLPRLLLSPVLTIALGIIALAATRSLWPGVLVPSTAPASLPPLQATPPTVITGTLSYSDALTTYESVATNAIRASERVLETVKWLIGASLGLATAATATAAYIYTTAREAREKARRAESAAREAQKAAATVERNLDSLSHQYITLSERFIEISQQYVDLKGKTLSLDAALKAWEQGEILRDRFLETQQWHSWCKWTQQGKETGWNELWETVRYGEGLTRLVRSALEMELERLRAEASRAGCLSPEDADYQRQLRLLLSPPQGSE